MRRILVSLLMVVIACSLYAQGYGYEGDYYGGCYAEDIVETYDKYTPADEIAQYIYKTLTNEKYKLPSKAKNIQITITQFADYLNYNDDDSNDDDDMSSFTINLTARLQDFTITTKIEVNGNLDERILFSYYDYTEDRPGFTNRKYRLQYDEWQGELVREMRRLVKRCK